MSKSLHKKTLEPDSQDRLFKVLGLVAIAVLAGIPFLVGKYFELNSPDPYDSAIYVYSAQHVLNGARIGVDEIPSAQVGTLLVNVLGVAVCGFSETGPKLIQGLLQLGALILMFAAMRRLFGTLAAVVGVIVASVYLSAPVIAKFGNVKEQHMIAFLVMGVSCFCLYQVSGKAWQAVLAGALLSWGPLFKQTGMSAIGAVGLFVVAQPLLRHRTIRQTGIDILLLLAGAGLALTPLFIWIIGWHVQMPLPYDWLGFVFAKLMPAKAASGDPNTASGDYVTTARGLVTLKQQAGTVFRYYGVLILPVALALGSILVRLARLGVRAMKTQAPPPRPYERFVLLLATWWLLDMAFVWVSPRPYEQYYLPLNASAAMLAGYCIAVYSDAAKAAVFRKGAWVAAGLVAAIVMAAMAYPVFAGIKTQPTTGMPYPERRRGYVQKYEEVESRKTGQYVYPLEQAADYIREHSQEADGLYVWGWQPGIYVRAQRFSPAPVACTSEMHVYPPATLSKIVGDLVAAFQKRPPKFIVDTHNRHFPYDPPRPPLELWPTLSNGVLLLDRMPQDRKLLTAAVLQVLNVEPADLTPEGFVRSDKQASLEKYEAAFARGLDKPKWPNESARFAAMKPLRDFVTSRYRIAQVVGEEVIFELKANPPQKEAQ